VVWLAAVIKWPSHVEHKTQLQLKHKKKRTPPVGRRGEERRGDQTTTTTTPPPSQKQREPCLQWRRPSSLAGRCVLSSLSSIIDLSL
jgi:hypothetical protein